MGRKRTRAGKFVYLCIASLIFFSLPGCATLEKMKIELKGEEASRYLLQSQKLLAQGNYQGALKETQKALSLSGDEPPGDEALFTIGLIYAHPGNPKKDYGKSLHFFKKLMKDFPQSFLAVQAKILVGMLQENEKLSRSVEELNQVIEKSKQVDLEIEEKKREKAK